MELLECFGRLYFAFHRSGLSRCAPIDLWAICFLFYAFSFALPRVEGSSRASIRTTLRMNSACVMDLPFLILMLSSLLLLDHAAARSFTSSCKPTNSNQTTCTSVTRAAILGSGESSQHAASKLRFKRNGRPRRAFSLVPHNQSFSANFGPLFLFLSPIGTGKILTLAFWTYPGSLNQSARALCVHPSTATDLKQACDRGCSQSTHTRMRNAWDSLCRRCYLSHKCIAMSPAHPFTLSRPWSLHCGRR